MEESNPEKYLREIRDIQQKNLEILTRLTEYEDSKISRGRWAVGGKILGGLLPYLLSVALVWGFYMKIEDLTNSVQETVKNLPKTMSLNITDKWDSAAESGKELWDQKDEIGTNLGDKWKEFREKE